MSETIRGSYILGSFIQGFEFVKNLDAENVMSEAVLFHATSIQANPVRSIVKNSGNFSVDMEVFSNSAKIYQ